MSCWPRPLARGCRLVGLQAFTQLILRVSFPLQDMDLPAPLLLPLLIVFAAGVYYIYNEVMRFMSKSLVRNKVVVIADAVSGVGTGK